MTVLLLTHLAIPIGLFRGAGEGTMIALAMGAGGGRRRADRFQPRLRADDGEDFRFAAGDHRVAERAPRVAGVIRSERGKRGVAMTTVREVYLGDGLYASWDNWQIRLRAPREHGDDVVFLEPGLTLDAFLAFLDTLPIKRE
jgi:hypothetical protein